MLRSHQRQLAAIVSALVSEDTGVRDLLAAVTPGGGKSLLPVLAAAPLLETGLIDRVCWIVPRDSLRLQAEKAFADPAWRATLNHALSVRAADNTPDPSRGLAGYVTTYQGVAAAPGLHLAEFRGHRTLLVVDEVHHLPALADTDPVTARHSPETEDDPPAPGRGRCSRCSNAPPIACCCRARSSGPTARPSYGCPIAPDPGRAPARSRSTRRAGPSSAIPAGRRWSSARCCR